MKIKTKLRAGSALLAIVPVILASVITVYLSYHESLTTLEELSEARLTSLRTSAAQNIERQFENYRRQVRTFSNNIMIVEADTQFRAAFNTEARKLADGYVPGPSLQRYYEQEFRPQFNAKNPGEYPDTDQLQHSLPPVSQALQDTFIASNRFPLGEKDKLNDPGDGSDYASVHNKYHPVIRQYLRNFGYYDIFLVDSESGYIVYSVFKELDFATSLKSGPYAETGIGEAFRRANQSNEKDFVYLTDFSPYLPSYNDPAAFIASPVYEGRKKVGVLIFQMPIDDINHTMTYGQNWRASGLGETGETYLVAADQTLRSQSRFLIEQKDNYLSAISQSGASRETVTKIAAKNTAIGLQKLSAPSITSALAGATGFTAEPGYLGKEVLTSYAPLRIGDVNWAIISTIDSDEAFQPARQLARNIEWAALIVVLCVSAGSLAIGIWFSGSLTGPIYRLTGALQAIERNADLTVRLQTSERNEIGQAGSALNAMIERIATLIGTLRSSVEVVVSSARETYEATESSNKKVHQGKNEVQSVTDAINAMSATTLEIAMNTSRAAENAANTLDAANTCKQSMNESVNSIQELSRQVSEARQVIQQLRNDSNNVSSVLDVIREVAEQTNLLALNAAIEAARAGEQGRGFAVVADEVRTLAQRTHDSTSEIQTLIEKFQNGTEQAVAVMNHSHSHAEKNVEISSETQASLGHIVELVNQISDVMMAMAASTEEQSAVTND
ncbi:MAG: methyl-accepting chemotaxis protein, partial [Pseudomonadales bacterium]|nr:methyl-accepting chemotaxis protein [Pseudomonadales bacterium]